MPQKEEQALCQQYHGACVQLNHFIDVHVDKKHGEQCQVLENKNLSFYIRHPSQFAWPRSLY